MTEPPLAAEQIDVGDVYRAQGMPDYPIAVVDHATGSLVSLNDAATASRYAAEIADQVERILTTGGGARRDRA
ncbi:MAG: hypothetical protein A2X52_09645 [Candidatus Rokubacteria bacterium GWC2_70_16]|nr:MAG: hypothetical protein A2X52_09645 [Candidatus Rokubacteria bacterium GWC2_70_16]OGL15361.1 MAG: hypothetical protein A3K12_01410 [Candidatus Rokubacteria bacterium RIFCSPLOWO2_12_FULL_71_19]